MQYRTFRLFSKTTQDTDKINDNTLKYRTSEHPIIHLCHQIIIVNTLIIVKYEANHRYCFLPYLRTDLNVELVIH